MAEIGDLFVNACPEALAIVPGMTLLKRFTSGVELAKDLEKVCLHAPLRHMQTRRGFSMSVAMTNCGNLGWVSDRKGYRYSPTDPHSNQSWPEMPTSFEQLAKRAASVCGFSQFNPDACLVNCYQPGAQMGAHQDRNEKDFSQPIVSVSLGLEARFFVRPTNNKGKSIAFALNDGDVLVFGDQARHCFHGVRPLKPGDHAVFGNVRWNLTFRVAA